MKPYIPYEAERRMNGPFTRRSASICQNPEHDIHRARFWLPLVAQLRTPRAGCAIGLAALSRLSAPLVPVVNGSAWWPDGMVDLGLSVDSLRHGRQRAGFAADAILSTFRHRPGARPGRWNSPLVHHGSHDASPGDTSDARSVRSVHR